MPSAPSPPLLVRGVKYPVPLIREHHFWVVQWTPSMEVSLVRPRKLRSRRGEKQLFAKNPSKPYVNLVFLYLDLPGIAAETELMRDCFGDRLGDRLGVVWRPESNANQPKHTTSNKMPPTSIAIQTIATQSNAIQ